MVTSLVGRSATGGSFQLASEGIEDNRFASDWLESRGFKNPIIIGHSNGGMLAAQHCADNYGNPRAVVLMSAHGGGRDMAQRSNAAGLFACDRQAELTAQAEAMVAEGRGRELMLLPGWWWVISAESFLDRSRKTPDTVENASKICCPSLYIRGDKEVPAAYPAEACAARAAALVRCVSYPTATTGTRGWKTRSPYRSPTGWKSTADSANRSRFAFSRIVR
jgi:pimeloyl-ACP methyl ester carboxylesterase